MKSSTTQRFWECYSELSEKVRKQAKDAYELFSHNPYYPSLHFKRVDDKEPIYSVRVTDDYRVLGILEGDTMVWYWIGSHDEYERLLK